MSRKSQLYTQHQPSGGSWQCRPRPARQRLAQRLGEIRLSKRGSWDKRNRNPRQVPSHNAKGDSDTYVHLAWPQLPLRTSCNMHGHPAYATPATPKRRLFGTDITLISARVQR